jgi:hypothetical protein
VCKKRLYSVPAKDISPLAHGPQLEVTKERGPGGGAGKVHTRLVRKLDMLLDVVGSDGRPDLLHRA